MMARCLRCHAGNEWIEGRVADEPVKIDWEKVWNSFDKWWDKPTWCHLEKSEKDKIQSLVEQQLRKKVKRRKK